MSCLKNLFLTLVAMLMISTLSLSCSASDHRVLRLEEILNQSDITYIGPWKENATVCAVYVIYLDDFKKDYKNPNFSKLASIVPSSEDCGPNFSEQYFAVTESMPPRSIQRAHNIFQEIVQFQLEDKTFFSKYEKDYSDKRIPMGPFRIISVVSDFEVSDQSHNYEIHFKSEDFPSYVYTVTIRLSDGGFEVIYIDSIYGDSR